MGPAVTQDVQDWLSGATSNNGWILIGDESAATTAKRYFSSENISALEGQRPRLTLRYLLSTGVPETTWQMLD
jgi:hypothetical protein